MDGALKILTVGLALFCAACDAPQISVRSGGVPLEYRAGAYWHGDPPLAFPGSSGRTVIACDAFGRCERVGPANVGPGFRFLYGRDFGVRSPFWYERERGRDRFVRTRSGVRCDRAIRICYKDGRVDKSETEDVFGERAGDRADDFRDSLGTARLFVTRRGAACDRDRRVCFSDGEPDRRLTERIFGRRGKKHRD